MLNCPPSFNRPPSATSGLAREACCPAGGEQPVGGTRVIRSRRGFFGWAAGCFIAWLLVAGLARAADPQFSENEVKSAFLAKFAMFVDWPEKTFPDKQSPMVIGIIGEDPFGPRFDAALGKESLNGRPFALKRFKTANEAAGCHILFVSASESERLPEILEAVRGKGILTVGDQERFAHRGGMLNFFKEAGKLRFEVNTPAVQASGLKVSSKLLQVARVVTPDPVKGRP